MNELHTVLSVWSVLGVLWWIIATRLAHSAIRPNADRGEPTPLDDRRLSVFKPLASPLSGDEFLSLVPCLESFAAVLDGRSEMLIGCHTRDEERLRPVVERLRARYPAGDVKLVVHASPNHHPNPKVAWMQILARHASGELWFWSDSDIVAVPGTIRSLREDMGSGRARFFTSPYVIRTVSSAESVLDTLFVNLELFPGAVLLDRLGLVRFGFGAGMLFEAARFRERLDWDFLGSCLAEDFHLGRRMAPSALGSATLSTIPAGAGWGDAVLHYMRWQKTVRWCRPLSFAAQLSILPALGWLGYAMLQPSAWQAWAGLGAIATADALAALAICRAVRCRIPRAHLWAVPVWSLVRAVTWLGCWLPWPIVWRGRRWWTPIRQPAATPGLARTESQPGSD